MQVDDRINNFTRLKWACRRGMLELDVLLGNFLNEAYPGLSPEDQQRFTDLLDCTDPELFSWLLGREVPENPELAKITEAISRHARSRSRVSS